MLFVPFSFWTMCKTSSDNSSPLQNCTPLLCLSKAQKPVPWAAPWIINNTNTNTSSCYSSITPQWPLNIIIREYEDNATLIWNPDSSLCCRLECPQPPRLALCGCGLNRAEWMLHFYFLQCETLDSSCNSFDVIPCRHDQLCYRINCASVWTTCMLFGKRLKLPWQLWLLWHTLK